MTSVTSMASMVAAWRLLAAAMATHHPGGPCPVPSVHYAGGSPPFGTSGIGTALPLWAPLHLIVAVAPDFLLFSMGPKRSVHHDGRITEI